MYKNYKIGEDGMIKYDKTSYKVAPERRFAEHTDEWKRRLDGKNPRLRRKQQEEQFSFKVIHLLYIVAFFVFMIIIGK